LGGDPGFDLAVVGSGIVGLAHAWAAARLGRRVVVIERDTRANGASIRNFGFITVTGQQAGEVWRRARRSRDLWLAAAPGAGIAVEQRGLLLTFRSPEAEAVVDAFLETPMAEGCRKLGRADLAGLWPRPLSRATLGALHSEVEVRVESRTAIPALSAWLEARWGVTFITGTAVLEVTPPVIRTSRGPVSAEAAVVCPGDDLAGLFPEAIAAHGVTRCRLSMLRLEGPGFRLPAAIMSDLGLVRYAGYAELPAADALRRRLEAEQPGPLRHGVHLIITQSADGSLVVGDSHHYDDTPDPFAPAEVEALILDEFAQATGLTPPPVLERWTGTYASAPGRSMFAAAPAPGVRLVMVTSGTGASTAFAIAEEVIGELYDTPLGDRNL
jgi:FAD dependent oxidoreductase TIGR03364